MTKKRSIYLIIFLSILLIVGLLASFVSFTYPLAIGGNYYHYSSFVDELVLGADISNGVVITYRAEIPENETTANANDYMNNTINGLEEILIDAGYKDSTVAMLGDNQIQLTIGNIEDREDQKDVISLIGNPKKLRFSSESSADNVGTLDFAGKYIKDVSVKSQDGNGKTYYYVDIQLDSTGTEKLRKLTESIVSNSGSLYMYLGETPISNNAITEAITDGHITMYSEDMFVDKQTTQNYVASIKSGLLDMDLTQLESSSISPTLGHRVNMWLIIAFVVLIVASFIYLGVTYRELGLMAIFNTLFYIVIGLALLQSIPLVHINISGFIGMAICYCLAVSAVVSICNQAKEEYKTGKKLHTCFKLAQKKSLFKILISNVFMFGAGVVCALVPTMHVQSFGIVALVLSIVNIFTSLVMFRLMLKLYSPLNFYKGERCNFKLEEGGKNVK